MILIMSKEIVNYSILSGLAVGLISLIILFFRKPRPCSTETNNEHSAFYNKTIILNSISVALLTGLCVYFVNKMLVGEALTHEGGGEFDKILTGSAPF
jgi:hypothetical protein